MSNEALPTIQLLLLERVDNSCNANRYYVLAITPTLFGDIALTREWGRIGSGPRRSINLHSDEARAEEALHVWLRRKTKRGYIVAHQA